MMVWRAVLLGISGAVFWAIYVLARASEDYPKRAGGIAFMAAIAAAIALAIVRKEVGARRARRGSRPPRTVGKSPGA
ncbi:MAG TPA: hypothetical protein VFO36_12805 [Nitrospiraceae bacterium]|nr:hypothetical protein [Nitrospiraceae bacterium]